MRCFLGIIFTFTRFFCYIKGSKVLLSFSLCSKNCSFPFEFQTQTTYLLMGALIMIIFSMISQNPAHIWYWTTIFCSCSIFQHSLIYTSLKPFLACDFSCVRSHIHSHLWCPELSPCSAVFVCVPSACLFVGWHSIFSVVFYDFVLVDICHVPHTCKTLQAQAIMVFSQSFFRLFGAAVNKQNQDYGGSAGFDVYGQVYPGFFRAQVVCSFIQLIIYARFFCVLMIL